MILRASRHKHRVSWVLANRWTMILCKFIFIKVVVSGDRVPSLACEPTGLIVEGSSNHLFFVFFLFAKTPIPPILPVQNCQRSWRSLSQIRAELAKYVASRSKTKILFITTMIWFRKIFFFATLHYHQGSQVAFEGFHEAKGMTIS